MTIDLKRMRDLPDDTQLSLETATCILTFGTREKPSDRDLVETVARLWRDLHADGARHFHDASNEKTHRLKNLFPPSSATSIVSALAPIADLPPAAVRALHLAEEFLDDQAAWDQTLATLVELVPIYSFNEHGEISQITPSSISNARQLTRFRVRVGDIRSHLTLKGGPKGQPGRNPTYSHEEANKFLATMFPNGGGKDAMDKALVDKFGMANSTAQRFRNAYLDTDN